MDKIARDLISEYHLRMLLIGGPAVGKDSIPRGAIYFLDEGQIKIKRIAPNAPKSEVANNTISILEKIL